MGRIFGRRLILTLILTCGTFSNLRGAPQSGLIKDWKVIDNKIRKISLKETELLNEKMQLELGLSQTTEEIKFLSETISSKRELLLHRIRYLNENSGSDLLQHLFESDNPGALERQFRFFTIATRLDYDLIRHYNRDIIRLEMERQKQSARISKLNELYRSLKVQSETFQNELKNKGEILSKIRRRIKTDAKKWTEELKAAVLAKNNDRVNFYRSLLNRNFLDRKGQLVSPSDANITFNFGVIKLNPLTPPLPFRGVFFNSPAGTPVRAMTDGTVSWIGPIKGLGKTLILDHGQELRSVYSRVQLANLKIGDIIEEGSVIGKVEPNHDRFGNGLYFEVREGLLPTDPLRWILVKSDLLSKDSTHWENVQ